MKRGTTRHPKFRELKALLQVHDFEVVGILESLWDVAAEFHDDGDIGRWSAGQIARAIDWPGEGQALVRALIAAGWLDEVSGESAVKFAIHDWLSHCPNHVWDRVKKRVQRLLRKGQQAASPRLLAAYEKGRSERNRNGAEEDDGGHGAVGPAPAADPAAGEADGKGVRGPKRPASSGGVRERPAAGTPNPRPTIHDPRSEGTSADADVGDATTTADPPVVEFVCTDGTVPVWQEAIDSRRGAFPGVDVLAEFRALAEQLRSVPSKRVARGALDNRIFRWLQAAMNNPGMRAGSQAPRAMVAVGAVAARQASWQQRAAVATAGGDA